MNTDVQAFLSHPVTLIVLFILCFLAGHQMYYVIKWVGRMFDKLAAWMEGA